MSRITNAELKGALDRLTLTITNPETVSQIEALSKELGVSYPDIVTLAIRGKLPK